ncbi:MAG: glycosyltransferase, partial [Bacteroidales bacterium]|nr:glycosyltransferase [Bacteroidales bacterium]
WEMIIIDDNSTDSCTDIIKRYIQKDQRVKMLSNEKNLGAAQSRNKGIKVSKGDYIAFLDSDDSWLPNKLRKQLTLMQNENIYLSYAAYNTMDAAGDTLSLFNVEEHVDYYDMLKTSTIGTLTTIYNAKELGKFYFEDIGHEDYVMKLQILKKIPYAKGLNEPLANYRIHTQNLSSNKLHTALWQWHIYRKIEKLSLIKSIYYFLNYTYHGIFKYR